MTPMVYLAPVAWRSLWQRPQRLAMALASRYQLSYVDPVGMRSLRWSDFRRIWPGPAESDAPVANFPVIRARYLPWQCASCATINKRWLRAQLLRDVPALQDDNFLLWIGAPNLLALTLLATTRPRRVIFDCMDRYAEFHAGADKERIQAASQSVLRSADLIFASSVPLAQELAARHDNVVYAPNGVDTRHFATPRRARNVADSPVIGFHGTLGDWLDYELLESLARARPSWRWEFVGPVHASGARRLFALGNVKYHPRVPYAELPQKLAGFDLGIIPFMKNRLTDAALPVKLGEYLAAGLPVVASRLASLSPIPGHVTLATSQGEWLQALDTATLAPWSRPMMIAQRRRLAAARSWDATIDTIFTALGQQDDTLALHAPPQTRPAYRPAA